MRIKSDQRAFSEIYGREAQFLFMAERAAGVLLALEFQVSLKRDHAGGAVSAQADAE